MTSLLAGIAAFGVYACMYAFRKPFTAAGYSNLQFAGIDYKIWLVIAQTIGYTISKFAGIRLISGMKHEQRAIVIVKLIIAAWIALLFFALVPRPYNIIFLLLNGIPLGIIYGLVFSYLEGRQSTEVLGAVLASSFIFASGFAQSAGKWVMSVWGVDQWWMPFLTGLIFLVPLMLFTWLLDKTPAPTTADIESRTPRLPMNKKERKKFISTFLPGLVLLITAYVLMTMIRDYRSNFAADIWMELGHGKDSTVFTRSEIPSTILVLLVMSFLVLVRNNMKAFLINHLLILAGLLLIITSTVFFLEGMLSSFWWMTLTGMGLYMSYVPFNCMLFERLIASFKYISNAGFIIYVADSFGYLGSNLILLLKNFGRLDISWTQFYVRMLFMGTAAGIFLVTLSAVYFSRKYKGYHPLIQSKHSYA